MVKLVRNTGFMSCRPRFVDGMLSSNAQLVGVFGGMGLTDRQRWNVIVYTRFYDFGGESWQCTYGSLRREWTVGFVASGFMKRGNWTILGSA